MSELITRDFRGTPTTLTATKILAVLQRAIHEQATTASAAASNMTGGMVARHAGTVQDVWMQLSAAMGAGESMTLDVLVAGTSIITGGAVTINTASGTEIHLPVIAGSVVAKGQAVTCTRVYTAGSTPAAPLNVVVAEWA